MAAPVLGQRRSGGRGGLTPWPRVGSVPSQAPRGSVCPLAVGLMFLLSLKPLSTTRGPSAWGLPALEVTVPPHGFQGLSRKASAPQGPTDRSVSRPESRDGERAQASVSLSKASTESAGNGPFTTLGRLPVTEGRHHRSPAPRGHLGPDTGEEAGRHPGHAGSGCTGHSPLVESLVPPTCLQVEGSPVGPAAWGAGWPSRSRCGAVLRAFPHPHPARASVSTWGTCARHTGASRRARRLCASSPWAASPSRRGRGPLALSGPGHAPARAGCTPSVPRDGGT